MSGLVFTGPPLWRSCIQPDEMAPHHSPTHTACRPVASPVVLPVPRICQQPPVTFSRYQARQCYSAPVRGGESDRPDRARERD